ncbi:MAG TPA: DNA-binding protein WhiA [Bacillota bacterium]|nr:DNA-binding protein WhiA [Bacillota bacterium]
MVGFSKETKEELSRIIPKRSCCRRAELSAFLHAAGSLHITGGGGMTVTATFENASVIRKALKLMQDEFKMTPRIVAEQTERLGRHRRYSLIFDAKGQAEKILTDLGLMDRGFSLESGIPSEMVRSECCRSAFLRGAFLARGSIMDPQKKGYHLEFVAENEEFASGLSYLMNLCGFKARVGQRKNYFVYLKDVEGIARFLTFISAHQALLHLEEIRVMKGMREEVNRLVNCDTANLEKTVSAAMDQLDLIADIVASGDMESLPEPLREVAKLRMDYPEASLKELGELAVPPMSKSAVNHRMRRLREWIKNYSSQEGIGIPEGEIK